MKSPHTRLLACLLVASVTVLVAGCASKDTKDPSLKEGAREVGHAAGSAAREVGQGAKKAGKAIGEAAKEGGKAFRDAVKGN